MTDPKQLTETELSKLYEQRKAQTHAPTGIKRQVMKNAGRAHLRSGVWGWFNKAQYAAIAMGTLLLVGVVAVHQYNVKHSLSPLVYTTVELHRLKSEPEDKFAHIAQQYQKVFNQYQHQQNVLVVHHSKQAILQQSSQGWQMQTCDQQLYAVSNELLEHLRIQKAVNPALKVGDSVNIQFSRSGMIVSIRPAAEPLICS